jgi:quercetin dioxygenase-like cupin family protein
MTTLTCRVASIIAIALCSTTVVAQSGALDPVRLSTQDMKEVEWVLMPNGTYRANLAGDDKKPGIYAYRTRFPEGFKSQPHFHPDDRIVTVLDGILYVAFGERLDEGAMKSLPAGSVFTEPAKQAHYVWAKDSEVVIQVIGIGPSGVVFISPKQ